MGGKGGKKLLKTIREREPFILAANLADCVRITKARAYSIARNVRGSEKSTTRYCLISIADAAAYVRKVHPEKMADFEAFVEQYRLEKERYMLPDEIREYAGINNRMLRIYLRGDVEGLVRCPGGSDRSTVTLVPVDVVAAAVAENRIPYEPTAARYCVPERRDDNTFTIMETANVTGYGVHYVGELLRAGKLKGRKVGSRGLWVVDRKDAERLAATRRRGGRGRMPNVSPARGHYTVRQIADMTGTKSTLIRILCQQGLMPGAWKQTEKIWLIPEKTIKKIRSPGGLVIERKGKQKLLLKAETKK